MAPSSNEWEEFVAGLRELVVYKIRCRETKEPINFARAAALIQSSTAAWSKMVELLWIRTQELLQSMGAAVKEGVDGEAAAKSARILEPFTHIRNTEELQALLEQLASLEVKPNRQLRGDFTDALAHLLEHRAAGSRGEEGAGGVGLSCGIPWDNGGDRTRPLNLRLLTCEADPATGVLFANQDSRALHPKSEWGGVKPPQGQQWEPLDLTHMDAPAPPRMTDEDEDFGGEAPFCPEDDGLDPAVEGVVAETVKGLVEGMSEDAPIRVLFDHQTDHQSPPEPVDEEDPFLSLHADPQDTQGNICRPLEKADCQKAPRGNGSGAGMVDFLAFDQQDKLARAHNYFVRHNLAKRAKKLPPVEEEARLVDEGFLPPPVVPVLEAADEAQKEREGQGEAAPPPEGGEGGEGVDEEFEDHVQLCQGSPPPPPPAEGEGEGAPEEGGGEGDMQGGPGDLLPLVMELEGEPIDGGDLDQAMLTQQENFLLQCKEQAETDNFGTQFELDMHHRVEDWQRHLRKTLKEQEQVPVFDLNTYAGRMLDAGGEVGETVSFHQMLEHNLEAVEESMDAKMRVVEGDMPPRKRRRLDEAGQRREVARSFLTCLLLANSGNLKPLHPKGELISREGSERLNFQVLNSERRTFTAEDTGLDDGPLEMDEVPATAPQPPFHRDRASNHHLGSNGAPGPRGGPLQSPPHTPARHRGAPPKPERRRALTQGA